MTDQSTRPPLDPIVAEIERQAAIPVGSTPAQLDVVVRAEVAKWSKLIREAGLRSE